MNSMIFKTALLASAFFLTTIFYAQEKYQVEPQNSQLEWIGKKVAGSHEGTIQVKSGSLMLTNEVISAGELVVDMTTIKITDINSKSANAKLKGHLESPDFFAVAKFPTSTLVLQEVEQIDGNQYTLHGTLTIKGHSEKVSVAAISKTEANKVSVVGETKIDRSKFDIRYGSGSFFDNLGDKAIDDLFTVKFKVVAIKP